MANYLAAQASSGNWIAIVIIVIILIPAIRTTVKHMKGEGDCCGGPKEKVPKKKIDGPKLRELTVHIEGMHCQNCKNRIEKHLNELDGVICKVNLNKKIAVVSLYQEVEESVIKETIEKLDFTVVGIE
ncbi:MAG: heavy-metal-associated domain-containing protein [Lachnospiraceae bacterium]|nr:heavy-metal-associated domain-containing protein [Lachnospiraceae bacterium]